MPSINDNLRHYLNGKVPSRSNYVNLTETTSPEYPSTLDANYRHVFEARFIVTKIAPYDELEESRKKAARILTHELYGEIKTELYDIRANLYYRTRDEHYDLIQRIEKLIESMEV